MGNQNVKEGGVNIFSVNLILSHHHEMKVKVQQKTENWQIMRK